MSYEIQFKAQGHPNIRSNHKTTLMVTTEKVLTTSGDCIIAINAETGLLQLPEYIKQSAKNPKTKINFTIKTSNHTFTVLGKGHPKLTYSNRFDMVARKSNFTCGRTLMIASDKAASDIPNSLVQELQNSKTEIMIQITYDTHE
jgi:hypothetical protein